MKLHPPRNIHSFIYLTKFWPPIIILWIITLTAAYIGYGESGVFDDYLDQYYATARLAAGWYPIIPIDESPLLNFARFSAFFLMFATVLVTVETFFYEGTRRWWCAFRGGHTIICGLGSLGRQYVRSYMEADNNRFIVIEANPSDPQIKTLREEGVHILIGDATDPLVLEKAGVKKAKNLIAITGSDTKNSIIAGICENMIPSEHDEFICNAHIINPLLFNLLQAKWYRKLLTINSDTRKSGFRGVVKIEPFNIYQLGGMLLLEEYQPFNNLTEQDKQPHILIIGGGKLGEAIIQRLPHIWQITPGYQKGSKYNMTLIDRNAIELKERFLQLYPSIANSCEFNAIDMEIGSAEFLSLQFLFNNRDESLYTMIYICLHDHEQGFYTALEIDELLNSYDNLVRPDIIVRTPFGEGMEQLVGETIVDCNSCQTIKIFPLMDRVCSPEFTEYGLLTEILAHATHENYIKTCMDKGETIKQRPRMVPFNDLPDEYKESNRKQVETYSSVLDHFGYAIYYRSRWDGEESLEFSPDEIELMAEMEHDRWWEEKKALKKEDNPNFVPYRELPSSEKDYDRQVFINLGRILARVNMKVVKKELMSHEHKNI